MIEEHVVVRRYQAPDWFTPRGVREKRKRIEKKGLPSFKGFRFITLTSDQSDDPLSSYLKGKNHMRYFLAALRKELGVKSVKWCWKLEFQSNGYAHWHLLFDYKRKFTHDQLLAVTRLWGLGRTNVEMVRQDDFLYSFKYAFKPVMGDSGLCVPDWFSEYTSTQKVNVKYIDENGDQKENTNIDKRVSFARVRFWQTSRGFYTADDDVKDTDKADPVSCIVAYPLSVMIEWASRKVQVIAHEYDGAYIQSSVITLDRTLSSIEYEFAVKTLDGSAAPMGISHYLIPAELIKTKTNELWKLQKIISLNEMKPQQVFRRMNLLPILCPF